jgi:hypothetical protein
MNTVSILALVGEVGDVANAAEDRRGVDPLGEIDRQPAVVLDLDVAAVGLVGDHRLNEGPGHLQPLLEGEQGGLLRVVADGQDDLVEEAPGPPQHVEVAVRYRVERARVEGQVNRGLLGHAAIVWAGGGPGRTPGPAQPVQTDPGSPKSAVAGCLPGPELDAVRDRVVMSPGSAPDRFASPFGAISPQAAALVVWQ